MATYCVHGYVSGHVQGVSFRYFTAQQATDNRVTGWAKNLPDGRVEFLLCGTQSAVNAVVTALHTGPPLARVTGVDVTPTNRQVVYGFTIS